MSTSVQHERNRVFGTDKDDLMAELVLGNVMLRYAPN